MQRYLPALVDPIPAVSTDRGVIFAAYFRNWDLPVPGSPTNKRCDSPGDKSKDAQVFYRPNFRWKLYWRNIKSRNIIPYVVYNS